MWDVKNGQLTIYVAGDIEFYLNYVGCKASSAISLVLICLSFILTMWDVKPLGESYLVKQVEFYLNYVGCKVCNKKCSIVKRYGFILTMWDVKLPLLYL